MKFRATLTCLALMLGTAGVFSTLTRGNWLMAAAKPESKLAHIVYFTLNKSNEENRQKLVDSCKKYLVNHPGVEYFACGTVVPDLDRPVNDTTFDVALHIVFSDRAAHDRYQTAPEHLKFIGENRESWKQVRVSDSYVDVVEPR